MDLLLVSPPVANFGQCSSGISVLTAYLRSRGFDVAQWDLAIDAFHALHSPEHLSRCLAVLAASGGDLDGEIAAAGARAVADIDWAKDALRRLGVERETETMRRAFRTIADAGVVLTAVGGGRYRHDYRHFAIPAAYASFAAMELAVADPAANPYIALLEELALPRLRAERPRALGISVTYASQLIPAITLARLVRAALPETRIVLGGAYLTAVEAEVPFLPASLLPADAIVLHDGEEALERWLGVVLAGETSLEAVPNVYAPSAAEPRFARASTRRAQTDLDALPVPMWVSDGLDLSRYLVPRYPVPLPLSRGCYWGRCVYCNISSQTASSYRVRSVERSIADMKAIIAETGTTWFDFPVDSFRPRELAALSEAILEHGIDVEWGAEVLLDRGFRDEVVELMARAGCRCLRFGMESASAQTLREMDKPTRPDESLRVLESCKRHGVRTAVMLIAGFPTETQARLWETFDFLAENPHCIDHLTFHTFSLVPGSPMAEDPARFGLHLLDVLKPKAVMRTSLPFASANPVGMRNEDLPRVVEAMMEGLRPYYPELGELWTAAIGGWMTFPACCGDRKGAPAPPRRPASVAPEPARA